ncbi:TRAP transporter small permease [Hoeflea poritis]|uniref:TRAP transporter small permease protein n=1 Tax=Hoeflea poritis TaxID=2993659 RepID=A0ABT4VWU1_9HYPH|nr:TRAP transporter small permease [Hoeflea poritis]MDA4848512.1 TRAP transporter small permease [Hoeflea poritis]
MDRTLRRIDKFAIWLAVAALISIMLLTCVSVTGRYFFNTPIPDDLSISEKLMVFLAFLPLAAVQASREHVFVTIFSDWLPNRAKVVLEIFGIAVGIAFFGLLAWASWIAFIEAYAVGSYTQGPLNVPHAPFKFVLFVGVVLFVVRLVVDFFSDITALISGRSQASKSEEDRVLDIELD